MNYAITLGFVPARTFEKSMAQFYKLKNKENKIEHIFVDQHYPINKKQNRKELGIICQKYGIYYFDAGKNLGLHDGFNWGVNQIGGYKEEHNYIGFDPDTHVISEDWDTALLYLLDADPKIGWASLMNHRSQDDIKSKGWQPCQYGPYHSWKVKHAVMNSICAWSGRFLTKTQGLHEPMQYYGHLESDMFARMSQIGMEWHFLCDYWEDDGLHNDADWDYRLYKWEYAHQRSTTDDFETWMRKQGKLK